MIVTGHGRPGNLRRAMAAGARGFLGKDVPGARLAQVIRQVPPAPGTSTRSSRPTRSLRRSARSPPGTGRSPGGGGRAAGLPDRPRPRPVGGHHRNYLSAAVTKLGVGNRHAAVGKARDMGWM